MTEPGARVRGRLAPWEMFPAGRPDIRTRRVALGGVTLRIAEAGDPSAPPIVLLHGWGASLYMWRGWFTPLAAAGYRAIAVDLPGHGLSDRPSDGGAYTLARQVNTLRALFEAEGLHRARTVAQSMAGTIALELALAHDSPVGPLVLVNPAAFGHAWLQPLARMVSPGVAEPLFGLAVRRWSIGYAQRLAYARPDRITPRDVDEYWAPSQDAGFARAMRQLLHEFQWRREPVDRMAARLASLATPPLAVLSGRDRLLRDARPYADALVRAGAPLERLELAQGGHAVNEEEPHLVIPPVLTHFHPSRDRA